jgi:hypothetical protein
VNGQLDMYDNFGGLLSGDGIMVQATAHWSIKSRELNQLGQEDAILRTVGDCGCRARAKPQQWRSSRAV